MRTKEEIEAQIALLERKIKALEWWTPEDKENVWVIGNDGLLYQKKFGHKMATQEAFDLGNVFQTAEDARDLAGARRIEQRLKELAFKSWDGDVVRHEDTNQYVFYLVYDKVKGVSVFMDGLRIPQGAILFKTEQDAKNAILSIGKEPLKRYLWGL